MKPLVSIIIPTFNRVHLMDETLNCVLAQTYQNWECFVIDDRSTDNTNEFMDSYMQIDKRFHYYERPKEKPKGANACRNYGLEICKGEYIQWLDSDDLMLPNKLEIQVSLIKEAPSDLITSTWGRFINSNKLVSYSNYASFNDFDNRKDFLNALATSKGYFPIHAYLMSKDLVLKSGGWDETLVVNQDGDFMSRIFKYVNNFYCAKSTSVYYRQTNENSTSIYTNIEKAEAAIEIWRKISKRLKNESQSYVFFNKKLLFKNIKMMYPNLIKKNLYFFAEVLIYNWYQNTLVRRALNKMNKFFTS
ncbi:MAG: glycosyltransferase family 2 protein [Algibacter sp.]|uniref:glycosyltransferase family 2 protein n=1 Tax=Algibacter sp. TaxID=1872428 RepID=UPI00261487B6|nr:glycosyltransferase family 2 protein [Algibacter sp.]MDG1729365.1 glycosyltransferase family 2 protein [Algibacter sp.]MDG2177336.1 glycosyltransferase family 2 protein [Algibacter sp.]